MRNSGANITAGAATSAADLLTDLKSGYLLGANPHQQFLAQFAGIFVGAVVSVLAFAVLVPDAQAARHGPVPGACRPDLGRCCRFAFAARQRDNADIGSDPRQLRSGNSTYLSIATADTRSHIGDLPHALTPTKGKVMSRMSSLGYSAAAALEEEVYAKSESGEPELTISQMSRLNGVSLRTLRFYEDRGLIKPRREGNARFYRAADQVRMEMILRGKKLGFTLTEINDLIGGKGANETPDLEEQLQPQQIVSQIGHLERQRDEIDSAIQQLRATHNHLSQGAM